MNSKQPLWRPEKAAIASANVTGFARHCEKQRDVSLTNYDDLHRWSVEEPAAFWGAVWEFCGILGSRNSDAVVENVEKMPGARWFPEARLSYAENLLRTRGQGEAIVFRAEDKVEARLTHVQLFESVARIAAALRREGVGPGDRVVGYLPNMPEAVIAMLATASIGAVWSSCSPDFGVQGVVDRFGQIEPKVMFVVDGYFYNGKTHSVMEKNAKVVASIPSIQRVVVARLATLIGDADAEIGGVDKAVWWNEYAGGGETPELEFEQTPFDHPLYIMFSSGTTGVPKCIVHSAGGTLIQHMKEHQLHVGIKPGERLFYFTTCGWMMWNWLVSALASGATLMLYDGSPFYPDGNVLFDFAQDEKWNVFGTSAKYIDAVAKAGLDPAASHDLSALRGILSTGSPLSPEGFDFVYQHIHQDVCLSSICGGTDIISCFILGNPALPVWRGEIQCAGLGMDVAVLDEDGKPLDDGNKGELCCGSTFPSMPIGFWNDPDGEKYHNAYFDKFDGYWCHGDYIERTVHGGYIVHGRSDAVLNPGGVRIGTAEIYRQAERIPEVLESLVIGQQWQGDVRVVLFVRLDDGRVLDDALIKRIRDEIRANTTPRHVPAKVIQVKDIPRTKSGKIVELAVRKVVHGEEVKNREALANPEALELFRDLPELSS